MKVDRNTFSTDGQYRKFLKVKAYFEILIKLHRTGHILFSDGYPAGKPFIDGFKVGFKKQDNPNQGCNTLYVGATEDYNGKPWVDISVTSIKKDITIYKQVRI
jgi:hypothetical protein